MEYSCFIVIVSPTFLPDPKDGSLYAYGGTTDGLKKLPFTIPELVTASPCRSTDGILYTGSRRAINDTLLLNRSGITQSILNPKTG